jgi:hypothetical protein
VHETALARAVSWMTLYDQLDLTLELLCHHDNSYLDEEPAENLAAQRDPLSSAAASLTATEARSSLSFGVLELLAMVGLILPAALDIAPVMVPVTAVCWVFLTVGARPWPPRSIQIRDAELALSRTCSLHRVGWLRRWRFTG